MLALIFLACGLNGPPAPGAPPSLLERGFRSMYNLEFAQAHREFAEWRKQHPGDPMGPVSDAAAYLFAEFDRLKILQSEFFASDESFFKRQRALKPDSAAKRSFEAALVESETLAARRLGENPRDENALFATLIRNGLRADYLALIEKRNLAALSEIKANRSFAERVLADYPQCYDAYLGVGVENYMLSLKPMPVRWLLRIGGAQTDRDTGISRLRITADKGRLLMPFARLLLAVAALREKDIAGARRGLEWLAREFPGNRLYREELNKLK